MRAITGPILPACQIRAARALLGWDQTDMARMLGITRRAIAAWELGETRCAGQMAERVTERLAICGVILTDGSGVRLA